MKRFILIILLSLTGIGVIAYPFVSNYLNQKNATEAMESYDQELEKLSQEQLAAALRDAQIYNENLTGQPAHDPFIPGSGVVMPDNYYQVLGIDETMGKVEIPKISVNLPIYHGTSEQVLQRAVGHLEGSTLPIGGIGTHTVLTSHTGLTHAKLFTDLTEMEVGDEFYIHVLDQTLAYQVDQVKVVEPSDTEDLATVNGQDYCTLLTCTPYGVNSHRLLVRGKRIPYNPKKVQKAGMTKEQNLMLKAAIITASIMLLLIILTYARNKYQERSNQGKAV